MIIFSFFVKWKPVKWPLLYPATRRPWQGRFWLFVRKLLRHDVPSNPPAPLSFTRCTHTHLPGQVKPEYCRKSRLRVSTLANMKMVNSAKYKLHNSSPAAIVSLHWLVISLPRAAPEKGWPGELRGALAAFRDKTKAAGHLLTRPHSPQPGPHSTSTRPGPQRHPSRPSKTTIVPCARPSSP